MTEERTMILQMLRDGKLTVDETERLLSAINEEPLAAPGASAAGSDPAIARHPGLGGPERRHREARNEERARRRGRMAHCGTGGADMAGQDLSGSNMAGAQLASASLAGANLSGANLSDA